MLRENLIHNLANVDYRRQFVSAQVRRTVASQIRALREDELRKWTQGELGLRAGMKPNAISRLENPAYGDFTINTLLRLANAFDVGLIVRFAAFSDLVDWNQSVIPTFFVPPSFGQDLRLSSAKLTIKKIEQKFWRPTTIVAPTLKVNNVIGKLFFDPKVFEQKGQDAYATTKIQ